MLFTKEGIQRQKDSERLRLQPWARKHHLKVKIQLVEELNWEIEYEYEDKMMQDYLD